MTGGDLKRMSVLKDVEAGLLRATDAAALLNLIRVRVAARPVTTKK
ncbi:hypothetical protein ACEUZ9_000011 [Paracoccus litorisediminis]